MSYSDGEGKGLEIVRDDIERLLQENREMRAKVAELESRLSVIEIHRYLLEQNARSQLQPSQVIQPWPDQNL